MHSRLNCFGSFQIFAVNSTYSEVSCFFPLLLDGKAISEGPNRYLIPAVGIFVMSIPLDAPRDSPSCEEFEWYLASFFRTRMGLGCNKEGLLVLQGS